MKKILRPLNTVFFDPALPFRARLFNVLAISARFISLFVSIYDLAAGMAVSN